MLFRSGESISVYGIQKDSKYVSAELFEDGVTISDGYAEKYGMKVGDTLELKEPYEDKTYSFEVKSIYAYPGEALQTKHLFQGPYILRQYDTQTGNDKPHVR